MIAWAAYMSVQASDTYTYKQYLMPPDPISETDHFSTLGNTQSAMGASLLKTQFLKNFAGEGGQNFNLKCTTECNAEHFL